MDDFPKYTVGTAARLVGVRAATLRAWERRYGFPAPARSAGRYRLFSDLDLAWVQWVRDRIREGIRPAQAVRLALRRRQAGMPPAPGVGSSPEGLREELLTALMAFDDGRATELMKRARARLSPLKALRHVLLPVVAEIGAEWEAGRATVSQEHFASQFALRYLAQLLHGPQHPGPAVLCACAPGEQHQLGLMYVAAEARAAGWQVIYLGADTPTLDVLHTTQRLRPRAVVVASVVADLKDSWARHRSWCWRLARRGTLWVWGGPGALAARRLGLPGRVAASLEEASRLLAALGTKSLRAVP